MAYRQVLTLTLSHDYYGSAAMPLRVVPTDASAFKKTGLLLRNNSIGTVVLADDADTVPEVLALDVLVSSPEGFVVTKGADWGNILVFDVATEIFEFDPAQAQAILPQSSAKCLARLNIAIYEDQARSCHLHFSTVEALWAYHVTGAQSSDDLEVVDPKAQTTFSSQGAVTLPDGRQALVIRSDDPLPAQARPDQKFALQRPSAFGPETLVPVLPAAGISFKPIDQQPGVAARLQSDIYVSLW